MKVAVQNEKLKKALAEQGFDTVDYKNTDADAVVYEGTMDAVMVRKEENSRGVLLINGAGKSPAEIAYMLTKKLYTPLF